MYRRQRVLGINGAFVGDDNKGNVIRLEIDTSLDIAITAEWDPNNNRACVGSVVQAILQHHAGEAGRFYAIAEALALNEPRFAALKSNNYAHVFQQVEQLVDRHCPHVTASQRRRLARITVALIDGASLQLQFGRAGASAASIDTLSEDISDVISHLMHHWR